MSFLRFLYSKFFLKHLLIAIVIASSIVLITFMAIRLYTLHGKSFETPDFTGMTLKEVEQVAKDKNLRFNVIDSVYNRVYKKRTVIDQNPPPGFKIKKNRNIFLTINASQQEQVKVPEMVGYSLRQANSSLEENGLQIGKITYVPDIAFNNVLNFNYKGKEIAAGSKIPKGSKIDLILGKGYGKKGANIPDISGFKVKQAKSRIIEAGLNLNRVIYDKTINSYVDSINAKVYKQSPEYDRNRTSQLGSYMDIWVTTDAEKIPVDTLQNNFFSQ